MYHMFIRSARENESICRRSLGVGTLRMTYSFGDERFHGAPAYFIRRL